MLCVVAALNLRHQRRRRNNCSARDSERFRCPTMMSEQGHPMSSHVLPLYLVALGFIFITDDQHLHLNLIDYQLCIQKHFAQKDTRFKKRFCTVASCCPSQVSLLTGKAAHDTYVTDVSAPYATLDVKICDMEEDVNIPFFIPGPGIPKGAVETVPSSHTDIVPALFHLAGMPL